ncbi:hypothetical protein BCR43DRAFT_481571 [Syncephalastrum racemosum]|uniref:Uncharacterized protein n=1 Tax=Syncephalastrum racemosum TaxID=13706 RepID=A0A1X2HSA1_SYNRA|nr:hypothetical protein BCR43DRAFT_481571 [Syncephalastrum racemosum]
MFALYHILSLKSLVFFIVCLALYYLLRDYPQWRSRQIQSSTDSHETQTTDPAAAPTTRTNSKTSQGTTREKEEEVKVDAKEAQEVKKMHITHYILAMPLATVYVLLRACIDIVRHVLFHLFWLAERCAPHLDAWLFDKVTVWLPAKYQSLETWYTTRGKKHLSDTHHFITYRALPAAVVAIEETFYTIQHVWCTLDTATRRVYNAACAFAAKHDWRRLAEDMLDVCTMVVWRPSVFIVSRTYRIGVLVYFGSQRLAVALVHDVRWFFLEVMPAVCEVVANSAPYLYACQVLFWFHSHITIHAVDAIMIFAAPFIHCLQTWIVVALDQVAALVQSNKFRQHVRYLHRLFASHCIWLAEDAAVTVHDIAHLSYVVIDTCIIPFATWFHRDILPPIRQAYCRLADNVSYIMIPLWRTLCTVALNPIWAFCQQAYAILTVPFVTLWQVAYQWGVYGYEIIQQLGAQTVAAATAVAHAIIPLTHELTSKTLVWLRQQTPIFVRAGEMAFHIVASYDWHGLYADTIAMAAGARDWIATQADLMFTSLEKSLSEWFKDQSSSSAPLAKKAL